MKSRSMAIVALTALTASGCGVGIHVADYRHTATMPDVHITDKVTNIDVGAGSGYVVVKTGGDTGVTIHRVLRYQRSAPHPSQTVNGGKLTFSSNCSQCQVDYDLVVPASVTVRARTNSGRINLNGVAVADASSDSGAVTVRHVPGAVTAHSDSGSVTLQDLGGTLQANTDSGAIHAAELRSAGVTASSDSGSIHLAFTSAPRTVKITNDSGSLHLAVPGGPYAVDVHTDSGSRHVGVPTASNSAYRLSLRSDSGSVNVIPAG